MKIYTKTGDKGTTAMLSGIRIRKSDERIELIGTIDELNSHIGFVKVVASNSLKIELEEIQRTLMTIMSGLSDSRNRGYKIGEEKVQILEKEIDRVEQLFPRKKEFVLYGGCELSARLDVARAVARRADRIFAKVKNVHGVHPISMEYVNRLADYLYIQARYADFLSEMEGKEGKKHTCHCGHHGEENLHKKDDRKHHQCQCGKEDHTKEEAGERQRKDKITREISEEEISQLVRKLLKEYH